MANIRSSMSKNSGLADSVMPEVNKTAPKAQSKSPQSASFEEHLDTNLRRTPVAAAAVQPRKSEGLQSDPRKLGGAQSDPKRLGGVQGGNAPATASADAKKSIPMNASSTKSREPVRKAEEQVRPDQNTKPLKATAKQSVDKNSSKVPATEGSVLVLQEGDIPVEAEATLETKVFDVKASEGDPWQTRLEDMLSFMGVAPQALQQDIPSLAILTGQLQEIEPEAIPSILADSPLLKDVMASENPEALIEQVKPLGMWLDDMGWSPDGLVIKDPEAFQDLMNTPVSLKDVMKTFEVDVDRVLTEAKVLQETLPMDGATPYIERASRMQAEAGKVPKTKSKEGEDKVKGMSPELLALLNSSATAAAMESTQVSLSKKDSTHRAVDPKLPSVDQLMASLNLGTNTVVATEGLPKVALSEGNPFQSMELQEMETFTFEGEAQDPTQASAKNDSLDWLESIQASQIQVDGPQATALDKSRGFNPEFIVDRMSEAVLANFSEQESKDGQSEDFVATKDSEASHLTQTQGTTKSANTFELGTQETQKAQPTHPINKAVFEKAEMLVKEGGGAIRIDIGNQETGAIDLAVEVKDGRVEVKITAESAEARQLIAQELPKLKESLQNQNLNLERVQVGLSGGSSWTSSDGRSSGRESSSQSEELMGVDGKSGRKSSRTYSRLTSSQEIQPGVTREGGGIQVRV